VTKKRKKMIDDTNFGQIVAFKLDDDKNECLVVVQHKNVTETYIGNYSKLSIHNGYIPLQVLHFGKFLMLMDSSPQTIEMEELENILNNLTYNDFIFQLKDNQFPRTVNKAKELFKTKKFVGMKASLDNTFGYASIGIIINDRVFDFVGKVRHMPFVDDKGLFCFKVSEKDQFLSHLLDDRLIDMTTVVPYEDALRCMKWISRVLVVEQGWDCEDVVELLNISDKKIDD
jgi:hypothetical protein